METPIIKTDHTLKQLEEHGTSIYPILISSGLTLNLEMGIVPWHWHNDFELTYVESGHFHFSVSSDTFSLGPGEAVFINSRVLHQVKPAQKENPVYYSYTFAPEFISETMQSLIAAKYIIPLMQNGGFPYHIFNESTPWEWDCLSHIRTLNQAAASTGFEREFLVLHSLQRIFIDMIQNLPGLCTASPSPVDSSHYSIMKIMLYIKKHYTETITLEDMANAANISKSSCNRLFHRILNMTPFGYLLEFRINQSKKLLKQDTRSITEIAYACGFHDVSYYCKEFRRQNGISPEKYRKEHCHAHNCQDVLAFSDR